MDSGNKLELSMSFVVFPCVRIIGEITVTVVILMRYIFFPRYNSSMDFILW